MEGNIPNDEFKIIEELILYKGRILLAANSKVKRKIMKECHDNPLSGHIGFYKLQEDKGEVLLERPKEGHYEICPRMYNMPKK